MISYSTQKTGQLTYWLVHIWHAEKLAAMHLTSAGTPHQSWMQQEHDELMLSVSMQHREKQRSRGELHMSA
jgi:hypothetical protein